MKKPSLYLVFVLAGLFSVTIAQERMIATAKQGSSQVKVYDEKGNFMFINF